jgi:hypothetical protein
MPSLLQCCALTCGLTASSGALNPAVFLPAVPYFLSHADARFSTLVCWNILLAPHCVASLFFPILRYVAPPHYSALLCFAVLHCFVVSDSFCAFTAVLL